MDKISWCRQKKEGLRVIEPNENLSNAYMKKAEEALESIHVNIVKDWKISTAYYTIYFSLYAILMKIGIKCEIHSCTIAYAQTFLQDYFNADELTFLEEALQIRINAQYYVDRTVPDKACDTIITKAPLFLVHCKGVILKLTEKNIQNIRKRFETIS